MIRNYFITAFRNLRNHKWLSFSNLAGLSVGIACCLLILLYIFHETGYDRFHKKLDRISRVTMEFAADGVPNQVAVTGNRVGPEFRRSFPEVETAVRTYPVSRIVKYGDRIFDEKRFVYTDSTFFDIFTFRLLKGNPKNVLNEPYQVVLTQTTARKYFGNEDPIGKTLRINNEKNYVVSGLMADCPDNSQIKFDLLASWYSLDDPLYKEESWWDASYFTYLLLRKPGLEKALESKIPGLLKARGMESDPSAKSYMTLHLQPMAEVHLRAIVEGGFEPGGDSRYVYMFLAISLLILFIACFNYINLATARATERAREVGVRKVMGALRNQLLIQFIGESMLTVFLSLLAGLLLVRFLLPVFNRLAGHEFYFGSLFTGFSILVILLVLLFIGLLGGTYPALVLSGFNPIRTLKGNYTSSSKGIWLRKSLIVSQFAISVTLIIATLVIRSQLHFIQNKKLGYDKEHLVVLPFDKFILTQLSTVKSEFLSNPKVLGVTTCNQLPVFIPGKYNLSENDREIIISGVRVDKDFVNTVGLELIGGSDFTLADQEAAFGGTDTLSRPLLLNESAAHLLGWSTDEAIGKNVQFQGRNSIVEGVVKDFHFSSLHESISPIVIFIGSYTSKMLVKLSGKETAQTLQFLKQKWSSLITHRPFEYTFLDEEFNKLYMAETTTGKLFYAFAMLAVGLACLGLLGMITFTTRQRTKEIGIRKVLGASASRVVWLLSVDFIRLVLLAGSIALPFSWWGMNKWLQDFAYRVDLHWWVFILAVILAIGIALISVSFHAIRAALSNPVKSLRME